MESQVEKIYSNAGVEKETIRGCYEYYTEELGIDIWHENDCKNKDCNICKANKSIQEYPPFTAEKQLELIKWLGELQIDTRKGYWHLAKFGRTTKTVYANNGDLGEALSEIVNQLWQDLTEAERKQIKEILE